jgi:ParB/RepB/Spo0J family partition protein
MTKGAAVLEDPTKTADQGRHEVQYIATSKIIPTRDNPRKVRTDTQQFKELVASIKDPEIGIIEPLIGRPDPTRPGMIDLRAGARRFAAALEAGLTTVPVIVRQMDDKQALKVTIIENKDRQNLTPIEEARGYKLMLERGFTAFEIAREMQCSATFVTRRAKLADLVPEWQAAVEDERSNYFTWHAGHLELVARFEPDVQLRIKAHLDKYGVHRTLKVKDLERELQEFTRNLASAPWPLDDATLFPKAGACSECPKRSCCRPGLFDVMEEDAKKKPVLCLDASCWKKKDRIFIDRKIEAAKEQYPGAVTVSRGYGPGRRGDFGEYEYDKAKKGDKGALPAVVVNGPGKGSLTWIKPKRDSIAAAKARKQTVGELRKELAAKRDNFIVGQLWSAFENAKALPKSMASAERLLAAFACAFVGWGNQDTKQKRIFAMKGKELLAAAWNALRFMAMETSDGDSTWPTEVLAVIAGEDLKKAKAEASTKFPEPAEWKGLKDKATLPDKADAPKQAEADADSSGNGVPDADEEE